MERAIIVGGGIGALEAAHLLKGRLDVLVFSGRDYYISGPSRPLILSNEQSLDRIVRGYGRTGLKVIPRNVIFVDLDNGIVRDEKKKEYGYDYLIIVTGLRYKDGAWNGPFFNTYDVGKLYDLKNIIWTKKEGNVVVYAPKQPYRCAPAPAETALTIDMVLRHRGVRDNFTITFVDANPKVQPPVIHDVWMSRFQEAGIEVILGHEIVEVDDDYVVLDDGMKIDATIKVLLPPNIGASPLGEGFIEVRSPQDLRIKGYDNVYAVGDVAKLPFPKNSEVASISARIAASQILADLGLGEKREEKYRFVGWAYAGNLEGKLSTESIKFELEFTSNGPKGSKDLVPKTEYTKQKDLWEQGVLRKLFGY